MRDVPRIVPPRGSSPRTGSQRQVDRLALDHAAPTVPVADDRVAVLADAFAHDGPDDGVQSRAVATTGQHPDSHRCLLCFALSCRESAPRASHFDGPTNPGPTHARIVDARTGTGRSRRSAAQRRTPAVGRRHRRAIVAWARAGCPREIPLHRLARPAARSTSSVLTERDLFAVLRPGSSPAGRGGACTRRDLDRPRRSTVRRPRGAGAASESRPPPARAAPASSSARRDRADAFADRLLGDRSQGGSAVSCVVAIDAGTTGVRAFVVGDDGRPQRAVVPRVPTALPPSRAGSNTTPTTSGASRPRRSPRSSRHVADARRDDRGDRHHQPAGDGRGLGPAHRGTAQPRHRVAGPPDRRALRRAARRGPRTDDPSHDRPRARPLLLGVEAVVAAAHRRRRRPTTT